MGDLPQEIHSQSEAETQALAWRLAGAKRGRIFGLVGELGAGKTAFTQAFLKAVGAAGPFTSPTFLIVRRYPIISFGPYRQAFHIDCYRLHGPEELVALDGAAVINNPENVVVIEWADIVRPLLPPETVWITFHHGQSPNERVIRIEGFDTL